MTSGMTTNQRPSRPRQGSQVGASEELHPLPAQAPGRRKREHPRVGWFATVLIVLMLLVGAGWEVWRWLLLVITMD